MTAIGFIDGINGQHADAVDAERVERSGCGGHGLNGEVGGRKDCSELELAHATKGQADVVTAEAEGV